MRRQPHLYTPRVPVSRHDTLSIHVLHSLPQLAISAVSLPAEDHRHFFLSLKDEDDGFEDNLVQLDATRAAPLPFGATQPKEVDATS